MSETCELALQRIAWLESHSPNEKLSPFSSVDPTPPSTEQDISLLKAILLDNKQTLFERYRAMFALRNIQTDDSILALCEG